MKIVYISGPMTGYKNHNYPAFFEAENQLLAHGFAVINPARIEHPVKTWESCMKRDIAKMMHADGIVTLDGWQQSKGAVIEVALAKQLGMPAMELNEILIKATHVRE